MVKKISPELFHKLRDHLLDDRNFDSDEMEEICEALVIKKTCETCKGIGAFISFNDEKKRYEVQRCDACNLYEDDVEAWQDLNPEIVNQPNKKNGK